MVHGVETVEREKNIEWRQFHFHSNDNMFAETATSVHFLFPAFVLCPLSFSTIQLLRHQSP